ncbi:MAG: Spx/MgsR family RNA polymerase-binding regulatory protein [Bacteroidales bacterium]
MKPIFIQYAKCGTCQKAAKWLKANGIDVESRDIITVNPTGEELKTWIPKSGLPVNKFFNTSGVRYKELGLKDVVKSATQEELLELLSSEGKLVKRPILIAGETVLVGFKEEEWSAKLLK